MLTDEEVLPTCRMIAKRFLRQGLRVLGGSREDVLDELTNVGYVHAKPLESTHHIRTWIIWKMSEYVRLEGGRPDRSIRAALVDRRRGLVRSGEIDPKEAAELQEEHEKLIGAMKKIDPAKREMLEMKYWEDMSYEEIGRVYGWSRTKIAKDVRGILDEIKEMMG